jgi:hypothetical protein
MILTFGIRTQIIGMTNSTCRKSFDIRGCHFVRRARSIQHIPSGDWRFSGDVEQPLDEM